MKKAASLKFKHILKLHIYFKHILMAGESDNWNTIDSAD